MTRHVAVISLVLAFFCHLEAVFADFETNKSYYPHVEPRAKVAEHSENDLSSIKDVDVSDERAYEERRYDDKGVVRGGRMRESSLSLARRAQTPFGLEQPRHVVEEHLGVKNEFWLAVIVLLLVFGLPTLCAMTLIAIVAWFIVRRRDRKEAELMRSQQRSERSRSFLYSGIGCIRRPHSPVFEVQPADEEFIRIANKHRLSITKY